MKASWSGKYLWMIDVERDAKEALQNGDMGMIQIEVNKRRELVRHLADFIVRTFGNMKPTGYQKLSTARAAITVFPRL